MGRLPGASNWTDYDRKLSNTREPFRLTAMAKTKGLPDEPVTAEVGRAAPPELQGIVADSRADGTRSNTCAVVCRGALACFGC